MKKQLLLSIVAIIQWSAILVALPVEYPAQGKVIHFNFNNSVKDLVSKTQLGSMKNQSFTLLPTSEIEFVESEDGKPDGAAKIKKIMLRSNVAKRPRTTVVMHLRIDPDSMDRSSYSHLFGIAKFGKFYQELHTVTMDKTSLRLRGKENKGDEKYSTFKSKSIVSPDWQTWVFLFDDVAQQQTVIVANEKITKFADKEDCDVSAFEYISLLDDKLIGVVDDIVIYDRILTDEELQSVCGQTISESPGSEYTDKDKIIWPTVWLFAAFLALAVVLFAITKPKKLPPVTSGGVTGGENRLSALENFYKATSYWGTPAKKQLSYYNENKNITTTEGYLDEKGKEVLMHYPGSGRKLRASLTAFKKAAKAGCGDADVVDKLNMYVRCYNKAIGTTFNGSAIIVLLVLLSVYFSALTQFISSGNSFAGCTFKNLHFLVALIAYIVASFGSRYLGSKYQYVERQPAKTERNAAIREKLSAVPWLAAIMGTVLGSVLVSVLSVLSWVIANSSSNVAYIMRGTVVGTGMIFNPVGLVGLAIGLVVAFFVLMYASFAILLMVPLLVIYKMVRNYILFI